jgi:hypothetical protein
MGEFKAQRHPPAFVSRGSPEDWKHRLEIERLREKDFRYENPYGGKIGEERILKRFQEKMATHVYSASQLENYAQCPLKFFASVILRLKPPQGENPDGTPPIAENGSMNSSSVFQRKPHKNHRGKALFGASKKSFSKVPERLKAFSSGYLEEHPGFTRSYRVISSRNGGTLQSLLKDLWERMNLSENPFLPAYFEKSFGRGEFPALHFQKKGLPPLRVGGRIDRIDLSADGREFMVLITRPATRRISPTRSRTLRACNFLFISRPRSRS